MGNACRKNVPEQIKEPQPVTQATVPVTPSLDPLDNSEVNRLEALRKELLAKKASLEEELSKWQKVQKERLESVQGELSDVQRRASQILDKAGVDTDAVERAGGYEEAGMTVGEALRAIEREQLEALRQREAALTEEIEQMRREKVQMDAEKMEAMTQMANLESLLQRINDDNASEPTTDEDDEWSDPIDREALMARMMEYYRPIKKPETVKDCVQQSRIDCAECGTQTSRNFSALFHHVKSGDSSWYQKKPIRGVMCTAFQCGNKPHDRWKCELCKYLELSDAPLLL